MAFVLVPQRNTLKQSLQLIRYVCKGQGIDKEDKQKCVMAHRILQGEASTSFNIAANNVWSNEDQDGLPLDQGEETLENFDLVMLKVAGAVFPNQIILDTETSHAPIHV
jgi:hypothetical protein